MINRYFIFTLLAVAFLMPACRPKKEKLVNEKPATAEELYDGQKPPELILEPETSRLITNQNSNQ